MISNFQRALVAGGFVMLLMLFILRHSLSIEEIIAIPENTELPYSENDRNRSSLAASLLPEWEELPMPEGWRFRPERDARNYGLGEEQCNYAFPNLWMEIERAARHRRKVGNITRQDLDLTWREEGVVRCMIYDHQLYIIDAKGCTKRRDFRERSLAVLQSINRAINAYNGPLPNIEFTFCVDDWVYYTMNNPDAKPVAWGFTRQPGWEDVWVMPDFGMWSWPTEPVGEYNNIRNQMGMRERAMQFNEKKPKVVWRGAPMTEQRQILVSKWQDKPWSDIEPFNWSDPDIEQKFLNMPEHCQWQYVLHTEGRSYSGRLKYLQNCHSVPIIPQLKWIEPHHNLLIPSGPHQNHIPVKYDFSDLEKKVKYYLEHTEEAENIADNNVATFRDKYLTPAAQACYWRKMFRAWREVSFEPELSEEYGKPRGLSFETYALLDIYDANPWRDGLPV